MKAKNQAKKNNARKKNKDEEEVIELNDASLKLPIKLDKPIMKSEMIENNSSEETTNTNKRKNNKKKKANEDLIEIMDVEAPEALTEEKKNDRQKKNKREKETKKDNKDKKKLKGKSCGKILCKEKSTLNKKKKTKEEAKIDLNEESGSEIQVMTEVKVGTSRSRNKSKSLIKKGTNKKKDSSLDKTTVKLVKKNKKKEKEKEKGNEIQQIELSENDNDESIKEKEKEKEKEAKKQKDKKKKNNIDLNSSSCSNKNTKKSENSKGKHTKSIIKARTKEKTFLGKKRKADKNFEKLVTPKKKDISSERQNKNINTEKKNNKSPSIKKKDERPKTPFKNNKNLDLSILNLEKNSKNEYITKKVEDFDKLIDKYGIEKVLDSLFKSKLDQLNIIDSSLKELKDLCPNKIVNFAICKTLFSYFNSRMKEIENVIHLQKRSVSENKSFHKDNSSKKDNTSKEKQIPKDSIKKSNTFLSLKEKDKDKDKEKEKDKEKKQELEDSLIQIEIDDIDNMVNDGKIEDKNCSIKNKSGIWNVEEKKIEKKKSNIGSHYNRNADGNLYKYQVYKLDGKGNAIFKCFDDKCNAMGIYKLETMKFEATKEHNLKYSEHEFIADYDKDFADILRELTIKKKSNAQVFKENGERIVKFY